MQPPDLLAVADHLVSAASGKPKQAYLKRAQSSIYYALFHCLAANCSRTLLGKGGRANNKKAYLHVYRALDHGTAKTRCGEAQNLNFTDPVKTFANQFCAMQTKRHKADYDPSSTLSKSQVKADLELVKSVIDDFEEASLKDRRNFCIFVVLKKPRD